MWNFLSWEESIAHQRSRIQWLELGDQNTTYFHKRNVNNGNNSKILTLIDANGITITNHEAIKAEAFNHFQHLFSENLQRYLDSDSLSTLLTKKISTTQAYLLTIKATDNKIYDVLISIKRNRSPGPYGFNVNFVLKTWDIVGNDFLKVVHYFLDTGILPHYVNATTIALIPKCKNP